MISDGAGFDLRALPEAFYDNPYPTYRNLREHSPIYWLPDGGVFLTRYADVIAVYKDPERFSSDKKAEFAPKYGASPLFEHHTTSLVFNDPPLHTRVRRQLIGALTPKAIDKLEHGLIALVDGLLERAQARGEIDLIEDFASAIPVEIIGNLLDVPRSDRGPLREWSLAILGALEPTVSPVQMARGNEAVTEFVAYLQGLVKERRQHPGNPESDVLTRLITAQPDGESLSEVELLQNCIFILNAGHETTTNLIGNALVLLDEHRDERRRLIDHPELIRTAVEEFLRYESSNQLGNRITTCATELAGVALPSGTRVNIGIGAANRDPAQFTDPDRLDIARQPNRHVAFGSGIHQCAGTYLARLEGRIAVSHFLTRFPNYQLTEVPKRAQRARFRGFAHARLRLEA